ncbi:hypothetical protein N0V88_005892 [Collariella sp. IMI 366227]|nr:hypothetical protein N0V88_005892 [Collariella sp. IMI 366227]
MAPSRTIITFGETSSPELSALLNNFRDKVILPTYLAREQRKKIYNPDLKQILQNDPVTMEIDGVVHKFHYINQVEDLPNTNRTLWTAVSLMKTPADFRNLGPLLEGVERAQRKVLPGFWSKLIRHAGQHGAISVLLECIKVPDRTGFRLNTHEVLAELLFVLQHQAINSGFDEATTKNALRQIQLVLNLIESNKAHWPQKLSRGAKLAYPLHRDPQMLAAKLHMAAARAVYHKDGKDEDGKVSDLAEQLIALWPENTGLLDLQSADAARFRYEGLRYLANYNQYLRMISPLLNGLNLAVPLVDPALGMQLQNRADAVDNEVKHALKSEKRRQGGWGEFVYNQIFNPDAVTPEDVEKYTYKA